MQTPKRKPGKYAHVKQDPYMTKEKYSELEKKLERLKKKRPHAAKEVSRLAEMGDFSENVEYQLAKRRLRGINNWILRLEFQLNHAEIIDAPEASDTVHIGHTITVKMHGQERTYTILGSSETNPGAGVVSHTSPIGKALLGAGLGETVTAQLPKGPVEVQILKIQ